MPEAYDASGNVLTENISDEISALLDRAEANGNSLLILTPPSNPVNKKAEEENRKIADCLKKEASERKLPGYRFVFLYLAERRGKLVR